jgi:hypothetical protein
MHLGGSLNVKIQYRVGLSSSVPNPIKKKSAWLLGKMGQARLGLRKMAT